MIYYFTIFQDKHIEKQQQLRPGDFCWYKGDEMNYIRGIFSLQDKLCTPKKKPDGWNLRKCWVSLNGISSSFRSHFQAFQLLGISGLFFL